MAKGLVLALLLVVGAAAEPGAQDPGIDCNGNGIEDAVDIAAGTSEDRNYNGIPDECEDPDDLPPRPPPVPPKPPPPPPDPCADYHACIDDCAGDWEDGIAHCDADYTQGSPEHDACLAAAEFAYEQCLENCEPRPPDC